MRIIKLQIELFTENGRGYVASLFGTPLFIILDPPLSFHHRCVRTVLGITNQRQWEECISSTMVREQWRDVETIETKLVKRRLRYACLNGYLKHDHAEVQEGGGEERYEGSRDV